MERQSVVADKPLNMEGFTLLGVALESVAMEFAALLAKSVAIKYAAILESSVVVQRAVRVAMCARILRETVHVVPKEQVVAEASVVLTVNV